MKEAVKKKKGGDSVKVPGARAMCCISECYTFGESKREAVLQIPSKWKGQFHQLRGQETSPRSPQGQPEDCGRGVFISTQLPPSEGSCL